MTQQEFFNRTGVEVSNDEFFSIHEVYCNSDLDKDEFCKMWCKMNASRVKNAKVERMIEKRDAAYKDALNKWFNKWAGKQKYYDNYHTPIAYTKLSAYEVQAMSYAGIKLEGSLSDIHYKVGQYIGYYKNI